MLRSLVTGLALACLVGTSAEAHAQTTAAQVRTAMTSRTWWLSNTSDANGIVMVFSSKRLSGDWYSGQYVMVRNGMSQTTLGFAWKPVSNGFKILFNGQKQELNFKITGFSTRDEVLWLTQNGNPCYWLSTRSWLAPRSVQLIFRI